MAVTQSGPVVAPLTLTSQDFPGFSRVIFKVPSPPRLQSGFEYAHLIVPASVIVDSSSSDSGCTGLI